MQARDRREKSKGSQDVRVIGRCRPAVEKGQCPVLVLYRYCARGYGTPTHDWCLYAVPMIRVPLFPAGHTSVTWKQYSQHDAPERYHMMRL